jgi:hypothetical protein
MLLSLSSLPTLGFKTTDPHTQYIVYSIMHSQGLRRSAFFHATQRWRPVFPLLTDHILVEIDPGIEDTYTGGSSSSAVPIPIEAKLRSLSVRLLYEICRVQKWSAADLCAWMPQASVP